MNCPSCDEKISDGAWMCPHCEHIVDASFLGNDITNEAGWADGLEEVVTFESIPPLEPVRKPHSTYRLNDSIAFRNTSLVGAPLTPAPC